PRGYPLQSGCENHPAPFPHRVSMRTVSPARRIGSRSTSDLIRALYASSALNFLINPDSTDPANGWLRTDRVSAGMRRSISFSPSGAMAPPFSSRTLNPLSDGGLWLAVILMAPRAF